MNGHHGDTLSALGHSLVGTEKLMASIYLSGEAQKITPFEQYFTIGKVTIIDNDYRIYCISEGEFFVWDDDDTYSKCSLEYVLVIIIFCHSQDNLKNPLIRDITQQEMSNIQEMNYN